MRRLLTLCALIAVAACRTAAPPPPPPPPPPPAPIPQPPPPEPRPRIVHAEPPEPMPTTAAPPGPPGVELPCQKPLGKIQPVTLYYATNRGRTGSGKADTFYGHANANALEFGVLKVTIPPTHKCGKVETSFTDFIFTPDPNQVMVLKEVRPLQQSAYFASIGEKVAASQRKEIFVFIHGYNNSFKQAALRAAELTFDLGFDGAPILFSWPSKGGASGFAVYTADRGRARESAVHLRIFLNMLATRTNAEQIHVIVHSMGNYVFQNALSKDGKPWPIAALTPKLHEVVLAAADLGEDEVKVLAQALRQSPGAERPHVTLYASANDMALKASHRWNERVPIGLIVGMVPAIAGVDIIDATALKCDFLAHSCFAEDPFSLLEMRALITQKWEAAKRAWIAQKDGHWYFCGETCPMH